VGILIVVIILILYLWITIKCYNDRKEDKVLRGQWPSKRNTKNK